MNPANPDDAFNGELSRRRFLRHAAWAGAAVAVTVSGGVVTSNVLHHGSSTPKAEDFSFVQISDSHIGFTGAANPDVTKTFQSAIDLVNGLPARPDFVVHTGDLTHYSTNEQFDQVKQMLSTLRTGQVLVLPGEHDSTDDTGESTASSSGPAPRATAGSASTIAARTSWRWSTPSISRSSATWAPTSWPGSKATSSG